MERSAELESAVAGFYEGLQAGDVDWLDRSLHDAATWIGTDPHEWWIGKAEVLRACREQSEALGGGIPVELGETEGFAAGDCGWFAGRISFLIEGETIPARHSGTLVREGGEWRLAQLHWSLGVANEWAIGGDLPV